MTRVSAPSRPRHAHTFQRVMYLGLLGVLITSLCLLFFTGAGSKIWQWYYSIYLIVALAQTWYLFTLLFYGDARQKKYAAYNGEKIAVIMPCYNESPRLLRRSVKSIIAAEGNKEILIVDDGSSEECRAELRKLARTHGIRIHFFARNRGKRSVIHHAIKHLVRDAKYIVTIDSDTIFHRKALINLVQPFSNPKIGAVSGDVQLINEKQNTLTMMIGGYYWSALHMHRKAQSAAGHVSCCSGAIAAYRASILKKVIGDFIEQEFMGTRCMHSEDRHLTNLVLEQGYDVVFEPKAIAYTSTPSSLHAFLKQQQRWRRGFFIESIYTLSYSWKMRPLLFLEVLLWELFLPFFSFGIVLLVFLTMIVDPTFFINAVVPSLLILFFVRNMPAFFEARKKVPSLFVYTLFSHMISYWQGLHAFFTLRNTRWMTR